MRNNERKSFIGWMRLGNTLYRLSGHTALIIVVLHSQVLLNKAHEGLTVTIVIHYNINQFSYNYQSIMLTSIFQ